MILLENPSRVFYCESLEDAEGLIDGALQWRHVLPFVNRRSAAGQPFTGPLLRNSVGSIDPNEGERLSSFDESWWLAFDDVPDVECALGDDWDFGAIERDAKLRPAYVMRRPMPSLEQLWQIVFDLESEVVGRYPALSAAELRSFWTSIEVRRYLESICSGLDSGHLWSIRRRIGSYVHTELRPNADKDRFEAEIATSEVREALLAPEATQAPTGPMADVFVSKEQREALITSAAQEHGGPTGVAVWIGVDYKGGLRRWARNRDQGFSKVGRSAIAERIEDKLRSYACHVGATTSSDAPIPKNAR